MAGRRGNKGGRELTPEEQRLWEAAMGDAKPLPGRGAKAGERAHPPLPPPPAPPPAAPPTPPAAKPRVRAKPPTPRRAATATPAPASLADLDKRNAQRLRRGQMAIEGRLDLHGLTQAEAHRALDGFIAAAHDAGKRCVLVITGKGGGAGSARDESRDDGRAGGGDDDTGWRPPAGVLRELTPRWLSAPVLRPRVVAWHPAQPRHGGTGALYVLLRRHRSKQGKDD